MVGIPRLACRVEPHCAQAGLLGAGDVVARVIADVHGGLRGGAAALQGFVEQPGVGLGDADVFGAQSELEVVRQPQAPHIGVAIGDDAKGIIIGEQFQGRLHLRKNLQLMAVNNARQSRTDRLVRVAKPHKILDPAHGPLIAVDWGDTNASGMAKLLVTDGNGCRGDTIYFPVRINVVLMPGAAAHSSWGISVASNAMTGKDRREGRKRTGVDRCGVSRRGRDP